MKVDDDEIRALTEFGTRVPMSTTAGMKPVTASYICPFLYRCDVD